MDYTSLKVTELRAILKERGIPPTGLKLKAEIIDRLVLDDQEKNPDAASGEADVPTPAAANDQDAETQATEALLETEVQPTDNVESAQLAQNITLDAAAGTAAPEAAHNPGVDADIKLDALPTAAQTHVEDQGREENEATPSTNAPVVEISRKRRASPDTPPSPEPKRPKQSEGEAIADQNEEIKAVVAEAETNATTIQEKTKTENEHSTAPIASRNATPALHPATTALYISQLVRPISVSALEDHLAVVAASASSASSDPPAIKELHVDAIRTHALVLFNSIDAATLVRDQLHDAVWPVEPARKPLWVDFMPEQKCADFIARERDPANDRNTRWQVEYSTSAGGTTVELVDTSSSSARQQIAPSRSTENDMSRDSRTDPARRSPPSKAPKEPRQPVTLAPNPQLRNLGECFRSTTAKPKLYWLPVTDELAETRQSALKAATSSAWDARRDFDRFKDNLARSELDQLRRYTFEDGRVVDGGAEWTGFGGTRGAYGAGRRGGGGYGGPSRGGRYGGRPRGGGDRYVP